MIQLREDQTKLGNEIAKLYSAGVMRIIAQASTGYGKTVAFSALTQRFMQRLNKRVLICVHREELLNQTRETLFKHFGISSVAITPDVKVIPYAEVYVAMIETAIRRLRKNSGAFGSIGLLINDEAHIGNFNKIYEFFPAAGRGTLTLGFTATPLSADKKKPLNQFFDEIVTTVDIPELIGSGALCPIVTYAIKGVKRKGLKIKNGKFDEEAMGKTYSTPKNIKNAIVAYEKYSLGKKTIVFNCNVEHSKLVNQAFLEAGHNSRHLDGVASDQERKDAMKWLANTDNAILNNVGIATTGLDVKDIHTVVVNRSTLSLTLWLQMVGRGARIHPSKQYFTCLDLGGNAAAFGDWSLPRDWRDMFHHPDKAPDGKGIAPIKECKQCEAILAAQTRICPYCGEDHTKEVQYDSIAPDFELITAKINVETIKERTDAYGHKPFKGFYDILHQIIAITKSRVKAEQMDNGVRTVVFNHFENKVREWCKLEGKRYNQWMKDFTAEQFGKEWDKLVVRVQVGVN